MDSLYGIFKGQSTDIVTVLAELGGWLEEISAKIGIPSVAIYATGAVLALILGLLAYKLVRLFTGLAAGGFAFVFLGGMINSFVLSAFSFQLNDAVRYGISGVLALIFFIIGFARFKYVIFGVMAMVGYLVTSFYTAPYISGVAAPITGAIVFALLAVLCLRLAYVIATSFVFGFMVTYMISCAFPDVSVLNLQDGTWGLLIAAAVALVMVVVQMLTTKRLSHKEHVDPQTKIKGKTVRRKEIITEY